ncbi:MAG: 30S ribosomal protein S4 [Candidatus Woesearchaeota archaeon]
MGDPKKIRKKYNTPRHPWIKARIIDERRIRTEYGTRNKKEIWKMETILKNFKNRAKKLIILRTKQSEIETKHLFDRVKELGLVKGEVDFDSVLGLTLDDLMERRLQTIVYKKGLARTPLQARQFIVHEHVLIEGKKLTSPSYIVSLNEEQSIEFSSKSALFNGSHPERALPKEDLEMKKEVEKESKTKSKKVKIKDELLDDGSDIEDVDEVVKEVKPMETKNEIKGDEQ